MKLNKLPKSFALPVFGYLVAGALFALAGCATSSNQSGSGAQTPAQRFAEADTNHDGKLSRDETSDYLVHEIFASRDANHDGRMTKEEWTGGDAGRAADFNKRDANHDGVVTKEEALAYGRKHGIANEILREADKDRDGMLSQAEIQAYYAAREGPVR